MTVDNNDNSQVLGRCSTCAIRHQAICGALRDDELLRLNQIARHRSFAPGQTVMSDDDRAEFLANVISGVVKLAKTLPDGRQQIVGLLFAPDFVGRAYSQNNPYFAEAATAVELCCFPRDRFEALLKEFPGLEHRLFERTLNELDSAREWMVLLGRKTANEKVASFLYLLAKRAMLTGCPHQAAPATNAFFELPLSRADIADYLGLTIETVSRQITKLRMQGQIDLVNTQHISVPSIRALSNAAGLDSDQ